MLTPYEIELADSFAGLALDRLLEGMFRDPSKQSDIGERMLHGGNGHVLTDEELIFFAKDVCKRAYALGHLAVVVRRELLDEIEASEGNEREEDLDEGSF